MEIKTTWNTDFEFDLQRFSSFTVDVTKEPFSGTTGTAKWIYTTKSGWEKVGENAKEAIATTDVIAYYEEATTAGNGTLWVSDKDSVTSSGTNSIVIKTGTFALAAAVAKGAAITGFTATDAAGSVTTAGGTVSLTSSKTITVTTNVVTATTEATAIAVTAGTLKLNVAKATNLSGTGAVEYTAGLDFSGGIAVGTTSGTVTVTDTATTANTIKATSAGAFTTSTSGTTFAAGTSYTAGESINVNGSNYVAADGAGFTVTSGGTGKSTATAGNFQIDTLSSTPVDNKSITLDKGTIAISGTDVSATVDAATGNVSAITAGATFNDTYTNNHTLKTGATLKKDDTVKINGTTFVNGVLGGADPSNQAIWVEKMSADLLLTKGAVYLDGSSRKTVKVSAGTGPAVGVITTTTGDIVVSTDGTNLEVGDLDNGDTFTLTVGTKTYSYTVNNGALIHVESGTQIGAGVLTANIAGSFALTGSIADLGALDATTGLDTNAAAVASLYASKGTEFYDMDVTGAALDVKDSNGVALTTVTQFASGSYLHHNSIVDKKTDSSVMGALAYDSSSEVASYTATSNGKKQTIDINTDTKYVWDITGTSSDDTLTGNGKGSTLRGGAGNDTITAAAGDVAVGGEGADRLEGTAVDATLTGGNGADVFVVNKGYISDYSFGTDFLSTTLNQNAVQALASTKFTSEGVVNDGVGEVTLASAERYAVTFKTADKKEQVVAWAGTAENGTTIGNESIKNAMVIFGNTNEAGDQLIGGTKNDTIHAGSGDTVKAGGGSNQIYLDGSDSAVVVFNGKGKDVVTGFKTGFDVEKSDKVELSGLNSLDTALGTDLTLKSGTTNMVISGAADANGVAKVRVGDKKGMFIADGKVATLEALGEVDFMYGTKVTTAGGAGGSYLDLSNIEDAVTIDLSQDTIFKNFVSVKGGTGDSLIKGTKANETIEATSGKTTLYGGKGNDVLVGTKESNDVFAVFSGDGKDTISGFQSYDKDADTNDYLWFNESVGAKRDAAGNAVFTTASEAKATVLDTDVNTKFAYKVNDSVNIAKVGKSGSTMNYDKDVTVYVGSGSDVVKITSDYDTANIWMDGANGSALYGGVKTVDGTDVTGNLVIAGNNGVSQSLMGGQGNTYLWGGSGSGNDTMTGGAGATGYLWGQGEGNDIVEGYKATDAVWAYNMTVDDLASANIDTTNNKIVLTTKAGNTLTANNVDTNSVDFKLNFSDGRNFVATKGEWKDA